MKSCIGWGAFTFLSLVVSMGAQNAGNNSAPASVQVPRLLRFGATIKDEYGNPLNGRLRVTFSLYSEQTGGTPLWQETQNLSLDSNGRYSAMLGSTQPNGVPLGLFTSAEAQWLGVTPQGQAEQPRVMLVSTPYALKAADAETIGGLPPSAFVLASPARTMPPDAPVLVPDEATSFPVSSLPEWRSAQARKTVVPDPDYGNGVIYASTLPGTGNGDIGDRVMQAYNQYCLAGGCRIRIAPNSTGGCWSYTTPINFNVVGKPATLEGDPGGASCILFTPLTGNAVSLDWGLRHLFGAGVRDLSIFGACTADSNGVPNCSGVTSEGLVLGLTHGVDGAFVSNVNVGRTGNGFLNGVVSTGKNLITGYLTQFLNDTADGNGVGVLADIALENSKWIGGSISGNLIGLSVTGWGSDLGFEYISFDANKTCAVSITADSTVTLKSDHFENPDLGTNCWMIATNGNVVWAYGDIFDNITTGSGNPPITFGGTSLVFDHVPVVTAGRAVPEIINFTRNSLAWLTPFNKNYVKQPLDYLYTGTPGRVFYLPLYGPTLEVPTKLAFYALALDSLTSNTAGAAKGATAFLNLAPTDQFAWEKHAGGGTCNWYLNASDAFQTTCKISGVLQGETGASISNFGSITGNSINGSTGSFTSLSVGRGHAIANSSGITQFVGKITTTASASDSLSVEGLTSSGHCTAQATNEVAAGLTGLFIVQGDSVATLHHSVTPGGTFNVFCSFD
jgi:hypothetical protein